MSKLASWRVDSKNGWEVLFGAVGEEGGEEVTFTRNKIVRK